MAPAFVSMVNSAVSPSEVDSATAVATGIERRDSDDAVIRRTNMGRDPQTLRRQGRNQGMVIIRGTRKFLDRVGSPSEPSTASTTMLGDWFATVLFWRPQLALFVNANTLLPVFMPLAPAATVLERFPGTLAVGLHAHGIAQHIIDRELGETAEYRLAKTNNRSVVGVMNEFARLADWRRDQITDPDDLTRLSLTLAPSAWAKGRGHATVCPSTPRRRHRVNSYWWPGA